MDWPDCFRGIGRILPRDGSGRIAIKVYKFFVCGVDELSVPELDPEKYWVGTQTLFNFRSAGVDETLA